MNVRTILLMASMAVGWVATLEVSAEAPRDVRGGAEAVSVARSFRAALASGDRANALATLAPNVLVYEHGGVERSRAEYAAHHLGADMTFLEALETEVTAERVIVTGELVVLASELHQHGISDGKPIDRVTTETLVLRKTATGWLIHHVHWSG